MLVAKFGGTSMKDSEAITRSIEISRKHKASTVVVSATSGTTNQLIKLGELSSSEDASAPSLVSEIIERHIGILKDFGLEEDDFINDLFEELSTLSKGITFLKDLPDKTLDRLQSIGERLSSHIMTKAWNKLYPGENVEYLDAREVIKTNDVFGAATPLLGEIKYFASKLDKKKTYVTQGFIGSTITGETTTLGRGGSDYSAALFAEAMEAETLQIWTDVAGIATTDPRICPDAKPIKEITFKEAGELATFGAKILHPTTLQPAARQGICVFVGSSYDSDAEGTWIRKSCSEKPLIRAMAVRKDQALLTLTTPKMLNTYGFLDRIFTLFNQHGVSVDAITTSEISVAVTIDKKYLGASQFLTELEDLAEIEVEEKLALVSLIGNNINHTPGLAMNIFSGLHESDSPINVRMICLGASKHNFCMVVKEEEASVAIKRLHRKFITQ